MNDPFVELIEDNLSEPAKSTIENVEWMFFLLTLSWKTVCDRLLSQLSSVNPLWRPASAFWTTVLTSSKELIGI